MFFEIGIWIYFRDFNFKVKGLSLKYLFKEPKSPKSHLHQPRCQMVDLKMIKKRDQGMENVIFMLRFKIYTRGVDFKIKPSPLRFLKIVLFSEKFANLIFEGLNFESFSRISI